MATFNLLSHFDWHELVLGPNPVRANALQTNGASITGSRISGSRASCNLALFTPSCSRSDWSACLRKYFRRASGAAWAIVLLIVVIAESSVSFSSKNIQLAQFVLLITLLLPRERRAVAHPRASGLTERTGRFRSTLKSRQQMTIYVDIPISDAMSPGLERITLELFSPAAPCPR